MRQWMAVMGFAACAAVGVAMAQQAAPAPAAPAAPAAAAATGVDEYGMPAGPGRAIAERACTACHGIENLTGKRGSVDDWSQTVNEMVSKGADVSDKDIPVLIQYLAKSFPLPAKQSKLRTDPKVLAVVQASAQGL